MNRLEYPVIVSPLPLEEGGGFLATVPDLPGCMSDGETPQEAIINVQDQSPRGLTLLAILAATFPHHRTNLHWRRLRP